MDLTSEIAARVEKLPPDLQEQVLRFVTSISPPRLTGVSLASLREFAGTIDAISAREMSEAIEEECERIDADW